MATATNVLLFRQCMTKEEYAVFRKIRRGYWNAVPAQDFAIAKRLVERSFLMRSGDAPQQFAWGPKAWQIYEGKATESKHQVTLLGPLGSASPACKTERAA